MGEIYKRGRVWYIDVRYKKRRIRRAVGASKKIAELALKDAEVQIAKDKFGFSKNDISIDKFLERFIEYSQAQHREATTKRYRAVIDHFKTFLQSHSNITFLSEIKSELLDRYKVHRRGSWVNGNGHPVESVADVTDKTRKGARGHTINFELDTLRLLFNLAIEWGYLDENPTKGVKKLKVDDSKSVRFLTNEECKQVLDACPRDLYPIYFTFLNTGMRKAELENLEWSDVDLDRRKIRIQRKPDWQPKTGERDIPINAQLLSLLQELNRDRGRGRMSAYVFPHKDGGKIRIKLRERLIRLAKSAGIDDLTRLHTLRHTFASQLVMSGVDLPTVKNLMGHSDIQTTMIYAHLAPDHLADAVNKLKF